MANKKITVVGDGAEQPLSPEEEHKIEVKIDKMLDLNEPDTTDMGDQVLDELEPEANEIEASVAVAASELNKPKKAPRAKKFESKDETPGPKVTKIITKFADDEPEETEVKPTEEPQEPVGASEAEAQTAPPLPKKATKKISVKHHADDEQPMGADKLKEADTDEAPESPETVEPIKASDAVGEQAAEEMPESAPEEVDEAEGVPEESAKPTPVITKFADDEPQQTDAEDEVAVAPTEEPKVLTHTGKTIQPLAEPQPEPEVDSVQASALSAQAHMQGSIVPLHKPEIPEENPTDIAPANEVASATDPLTAEDEAIARAFDTKESPGFGERASQVISAIFSRTTARVLVILVIIAAIAVPVVMPNVRTQLTNLVNHHNSNTPAPATPVPNQTQKGASATPAVQAAEVYVAKQNATYNVYKADIHGQNPILLLTGTGSEQANTMSLVPNPAGTAAAYISNRSAGVQTVTVIDLSSGKSEAIDTSATIHIIDWYGDRLVYVLTKTTTATGDVNRDQLISYNAKTKQRLQLDHAAYFNDMVSAQGNIYYTTISTSGAQQFAKVSPTDANKQVLLNAEIWRIYRTDYDHLVLGTATTWYSYKIGDAKPATTNSAYLGKSRLYIDSADGKHSLWVDSSSGQAILKIYDVTTGKDMVVSQQPGLGYPVRWLDNSTVAYRVSTPSETADYRVSIRGGTGQKIADVAAVAGLTLWY